MIFAAGGDTSGVTDDGGGTLSIGGLTPAEAPDGAGLSLAAPSRLISGMGVRGATAGEGGRLVFPIATLFGGAEGFGLRVVRELAGRGFGSTAGAFGGGFVVALTGVVGFVGGLVGALSAKVAGFAEGAGFRAFAACLGTETFFRGGSVDCWTGAGLAGSSEVVLVPGSTFFVSSILALLAISWRVRSASETFPEGISTVSKTAGVEAMLMGYRVRRGWPVWNLSDSD